MIVKAVRVFMNVSVFMAILTMSLQTYDTAKDWTDYTGLALPVILMLAGRKRVVDFYAELTTIVMRSEP
jgi:hypothetical protein